MHESKILDGPDICMNPKIRATTALEQWKTMKTDEICIQYYESAVKIPSAIVPPVKIIIYYGI
jgi:hypothetical protein